MARKKITIDDAIKELERELKMRDKVYPNQVSSGRLNKSRAEIQYKRMEHALILLRQLKGMKSTSIKIVQGTLFKNSN